MKAYVLVGVGITWEGGVFPPTIFFQPEKSLFGY
jgi:hypothetical protein